MTKRPSSPASGVDSTWAAQPTSGDWNSTANWNPAQIPTDAATFGSSSRTGITFAAGSSASVNSITFNPGAPTYTFTFNAPAPNAPGLTIAGQGIANNSASTQQIVVASSAQGYQQAQLKFINAATAGGANMSYAVGPAGAAAPGGGVLGFYNTANAGSALFTVTTGAGTPVEPSTVGGEVSFSDSSSAATSRFTVYGSTSTTDGDTFGNVVFHDTATAANGVFTNIGGTVAKGDGGNTQFYDNATAADGLFHNLGGSVSAANGGDVAFDGTSNAGSGRFHNYPAAASGGYGGVTSFNNNKPYMSPNAPAASALNGVFYNYGAKASGQGGGHTYFTGKFGSATGGNGTFVNYGSAVAGSASCAGHTVFSISLPQKTAYCPDAGNGVFWNFPGTANGAPGGYTEFTVYSDNNAPIAGSTGPTAGTGTFINMGALVQGAGGGQTSFSGTTNAEQAKLIASGGINGGLGGKIAFYDQSSGGSANIGLYGNATLDISSHNAPGLTVANLELAPGIIEVTVGTATTCLAVTGTLAIASSPAAFLFKAGSGFALNTAYTILTAPNLSKLAPSYFTGNALNQGAARFAIVGNSLQVTFS